MRGDVKMSWENYGDVNPLEHGGLFIRKDPDFKDCYYVIEVYMTDDEESWLMGDCYVDISDDWIDWKGALGYTGDDPSEATDIDRVIGAYSYYGAENFGGSYSKWNDKDQLIEVLEVHGIEIEEE